MGLYHEVEVNNLTNFTPRLTTISSWTPFALFSPTSSALSPNRFFTIEIICWRDSVCAACVSCSLDCPCCCNLFALSRSFSTSDPPVVRLLGRRPWPLASESLTEVAVSKERRHIKKVKRELPKNKKISSQWPPGEGHEGIRKLQERTEKH